MMNFIAVAVFALAFGASVYAIMTTIADSWPRIVEVLDL